MASQNTNNAFASTYRPNHTPIKSIVVSWINTMPRADLPATNYFSRKAQLQNCLRTAESGSEDDRLSKIISQVIQGGKNWSSRNIKQNIFLLVNTSGYSTKVTPFTFQVVQHEISGLKHAAKSISCANPKNLLHMRVELCMPVSGITWLHQCATYSALQTTW